MVAVVAACGGGGSGTTVGVADGWRTIEYRGVHVDVPSSWTRADTTGCEFRFERWTPPDTSPCDPESGVAFYASATFDPAHGPGARQDGEAWSGYVRAGDYAVYVADDDRELVRHVLRSAGPRAPEPGR